MKELIQSDSALDPGKMKTDDWGSELDDVQILKRQLAEMADEILFMLRKKPEPAGQPGPVGEAEIE